MNVIETTGLCKAYGAHFAVDHVELAVPALSGQTARANPPP